jgi:hypothetical protein
MSPQKKTEHVGVKWVQASINYIAIHSAKNNKMWISYNVINNEYGINLAAMQTDPPSQSIIQ